MTPHSRGLSARPGSAPSLTNMNDEIRLAAVTVAASFAATFSYLWLHSVPNLPAASPPLIQPSGPPSVDPPLKRPPPIAAPAPAPAETQAASRPAATSAVPAANLDGPTLPVLVSFANVPDPSANREENSEGGLADDKTRNQLDISSTSEQLLAVTVIDVNVAAQKSSSTQVLLSPNGQAHINSDAGLPIASGDEITLRSPGFRDMSQKAP